MYEYLFPEFWSSALSGYFQFFQRLVVIPSDKQLGNDKRFSHIKARGDVNANFPNTKLIYTKLRNRAQGSLDEFV